jgi:hypothetical protein
MTKEEQVRQWAAFDAIAGRPIETFDTNPVEHTEANRQLYQQAYREKQAAMKKIAELENRLRGKVEKLEPR